MANQFRLILCGIVIALFFISTGVNAYITVAYIDTSSDPGWTAENKENGRLEVVQVRPDGPAAFLKEGDELLTLNDRTCSNLFDVGVFFRHTRSGEKYTVLVRRGGQIMKFTLFAEPLPFGKLILRILQRLFIPAIFLITGLVVFLLKPYDKLCVMLALMFALFTGASSYAYADVPQPLQIVLLITRTFWVFFFPVFFHFFLLFPDPNGMLSPLLRRFPKLEFHLYLPFLIATLPAAAIFNTLLYAMPEDAFRLIWNLPWVFRTADVVTLSYVAFGLISLLVNYAKADRLFRRKMRIVVAGSILGFLPLALFVTASLFYDLSSISEAARQFLLFSIFLPLPLFPLLFAYSIVRHQVLPISLIIRRGVRYLLVSRGVFIIEAAVVVAMIGFLLSGSRIDAIDRLGTRADLIVGMLLSLIAVWMLRIVNRRVIPIIDRSFFREAYDAQQILTELGQEVRLTTTTGQMLESVASKIQNALHVENVSIFLRDDDTGAYSCAICSTHLEKSGTLEISKSDRRNGINLAKDSFVVNRLIESPLPLSVDYQDPSSWAHALTSGGVGNGEKKREYEILQSIKSALLLPISIKTDLLGFVSLGPRLADLPFSGEDKRLLTSAALQMAYAIENAKLVQQMAQEERFRQELEMATEVQQRLFPVQPINVSSLDLAGVCYPARGVGGDYYDFLLFGNGKVGIAVADVAGKGISAALLMSIIQASLRSQAGTCLLTDLVSSMNQLLHRSTGPSSYATFFYAQYDEQTQKLSYVNAGHNPPLFYRCGNGLNGEKPTSSTDDGDLEALTTGGPAIGLFDNCVYDQGSIELQSEDIIVAYTDGVTEALNGEGVEFGESRLKKVILESPMLTAGELSEKIIESVNLWSEGTPQHDDLTLAIIKVK